jgi:hypothetical protein
MRATGPDEFEYDADKFGDVQAMVHGVGSGESGDNRVLEKVTSRNGLVKSRFCISLSDGVLHQQEMSARGRPGHGITPMQCR